MSALTVFPDITSADKTMPDPGNAGALPLSRSHQHVEIVTAGSETRTLRAPPHVGFEITLELKTDGGDCVITTAVEINAAGTTTITLNDAGDFVKLVGVSKSGTLVWRVLAANTGTLALDAATVTSLTSTGAILNTSAGGVGYGTGAGGAVTQLTSKSTGVTLNKLTGQITMHNAALNAGVEVAFTLTNSTIAATDVVVVSIASGGTSAAYLVSVTAVGAGSCEITVSNASAGNLSEALVLNFAVIKGVAA